MANISDVMGEFQLINGDVLDKNIVHQTLKMIKDELEDAQYATFINIAPEQTMTETELFIENGYESDFNGTGRWTYQNNAENMFEWINHEEFRQHNYDKLLRTLDDNNVQFHFLFVEYEPGGMPDFLNSMGITVKPYFDKEENRFKTLTLDNTENTPIPINDETLVQYGFIDDVVLSYDDIKHRRKETLNYFDDDEIESWLEEYEDEFEDADGTINLYVPENEIFIPAANQPEMV